MVCGSPTPTIHRGEDGPGIEPLTACTHHSKVVPGSTSFANVKLVPVIWLDVAVLYDTTNNLLESLDKPVLTWNTVSGATGYIVKIRNESGQYTFKSAPSSGESRTG